MNYYLSRINTQMKSTESERTIKFLMSLNLKSVGNQISEKALIKSEESDLGDSTTICVRKFHYA